MFKRHEKEKKWEKTLKSNEKNMRSKVSKCAREKERVKKETWLFWDCSTERKSNDFQTKTTKKNILTLEGISNVAWALRERERRRGEENQTKQKPQKL